MGSVFADMSHGGVKDPSFAVGDGHQHGLIAASTFFGGIRVGGGKDLHVFGRTAKGTVQFIFSVHPGYRKSFQDRMVGFSGPYQVFVLRTMRAGSSFGGIYYQLIILVIDIGAIFFVALVPATESDDFVVLFPVGEGVVGLVVDHDATTILHILEEGGFGSFRPRV